MSPGPSAALWEFLVDIGHSWKSSGVGSVTDLPPRTPWALALSLEWTSQLLAWLPGPLGGRQGREETMFP